MLESWLAYDVPHPVMTDWCEGRCATFETETSELVPDDSKKANASDSITEKHSLSLTRALCGGELLFPDEVTRGRSGTSPCSSP